MADLNSVIDAQFPDNTTAKITPAVLRGVLHQVVNRGPNARLSLAKGVIFLTQAEAVAAGRPEAASLDQLDPLDCCIGTVCYVDLPPSSTSCWRLLTYDDRPTGSPGQLRVYFDGNGQRNYNLSPLDGLCGAKWVEKPDGTGGGAPLTPATSTALGGIKVGKTLEVTPDGVLNVSTTPIRVGTVLFGTAATERTRVAFGFVADRVALASWQLLGAGTLGDFQFTLCATAGNVQLGTYQTSGDVNLAIAQLPATTLAAGYYVLADYLGAATGVIVNFTLHTL